MDITNAKRAECSVHACAVIQEYTGKIVVIKYGGNAMINEDLKDSVMMDIVLLSLIGVRVVLVHGGGPEITDMLKKIGKESVFVDGLRVTDRETADTVDRWFLRERSTKALSHGSKTRAETPSGCPHGRTA